MSGRSRSDGSKPMWWAWRLPHDSAALHVSGAAIYIDDMREPEGTVHVVPGYAAAGARGRIAKTGSRCGARHFRVCSPC